MKEILFYVLQVNILITLIYLGYHFLLKGLTFYKLNRCYFLVGTIYAFTYPFLDLNTWFAKPIALPVGQVLDYLPIETVQNQIQFSFANLLVYVLIIGSSAWFVRLIVQLISLLRIHIHSSPSAWREFVFRNVVFPIAPFSFFRSIYVHIDQHLENELYDIFKHEHVHVDGHHTWDVLWLEMVLVSCWYNPFVWLLRKAVRQNLEYLTDQQVLDKGVDRQHYQYSLLNVTKQGACVGISNQFNFKTLKKRIMMMNKKRSSKLELSKYAFLLPIFILGGATLTLHRAEAKIENVAIKAAESDVSQLTGSLKKLVDTGDTTKKKNSQNKTNEIIVGGRNIDPSTDDLQTVSKDAKLRSVVVRGYPSKFKSVLDNQEQKNNVIVIDGKVMPKDFDVSLLDDRRIKNVVVLTAEDAKPYTGKADANVLSITTLKKGEPSSRVWTLQGNPVRDNNKPVVVRGFISDDANIKYRINGKDASVDLYKEIAPEDIFSVNVQKTKDAIDSNSSGVIDIITKDYAKQHNISKKTNLRDNGRVANDEVVIRGLGKRDQDSSKRNIVYVVDGLKTSEKKFHDIHPNQIESMDVIKAGAKALYGPNVEGAIIVTTRANSKVIVSQDKQKAAPAIEKLPENVYYVVDGEKSTYKKVQKIPTDDIDHVDVLKDSSARELYGNKAKNGAVIITTKSKK